MIKVYIASPYTKGDTAVNVKRQLDVADKLMNKSGNWYEYTADGIEKMDNLYHSAFSEFRYVPYPHEHPKLKKVYG